MKIYIQTNKQQFLASKISAYSFKRFGLDVKLINFEENDFLKKYVNKKYLRNKKLTKYKDDLQSFTILRFLAPKLSNYNGKILVTDPDVFALSNPNIIINETDDAHNIYCTFYNNFPRSEVMLIDAEKVLWNFEEVVKNLFSKKLDYKNLMNLTFDKTLKIKKIQNKFNTHDCINESTVLLHTTNRLTQPWKEGLDIDFERHNFSYYNFMKNLLKKFLNKDFDKNFFVKKYQQHPNMQVINTVKQLFFEARKENFITEDEINHALKNNYISKKFIV